MSEKNYTLLTPSARSAFEEMKEGYGDALFEKALEIAHHYSTGDKEISLRDMVEAQNTILDSNGDISRLKRKERMATAALISGFSYAVLGIVMYFSLNGVPSLNELLDYRYLWMLIIIAGMALMLMPIITNFERTIFLKRTLRYDNGFSTYNSPETVVKMWAMIEQKAKELMVVRGIDTNDSSSFVSVYDFLTHELNSRDYIDSISEVSSIRNHIVHSQEFSIKREDLEHVLNQAESIINELDKRIRVSSNKHL